MFGCFYHLHSALVLFCSWHRQRCEWFDVWYFSFCLWLYRMMVFGVLALILSWASLGADVATAVVSFSCQTRCSVMTWWHHHQTYWYSRSIGKKSGRFFANTDIIKSPFKVYSCTAHTHLWRFLRVRVHGFRTWGWSQWVYWYQKLDYAAKHNRWQSTAVCLPEGGDKLQMYFFWCVRVCVWVCDWNAGV